MPLNESKYRVCFCSILENVWDFFDCCDGVQWEKLWLFEEFLRNQFNFKISSMSVSCHYSLPKCNYLRFDFPFCSKQRLKVNVWTLKGRPTQSLANNNCWQLHSLIFNHHKWWCGQFVCGKQWKYKYQVFVTEVAWISKPSWATTNWCCGFAECMAVNSRPGSTEEKLLFNFKQI